MPTRPLAPSLVLLALCALAPPGCGDDDAPPELCSNGVDDDRDGRTDCDDTDDCDGVPACTTPPAEVDCDDRRDDDDDGATDCDDDDCDDDPDCDTPPPAETDCDDGRDDDRDGRTDCDDEDCDDDPDCDTPPPVETDCGNHLDDDGDGLTDCTDVDDCADTPACAIAPERCANGLDDDRDGATDCDDEDCAGRPECVPPFEACANDLDDDRDGLTDCDDLDDCVGHPACLAACGDELDPLEDNDTTATAADPAAATGTLYAVDGDPDFFAVGVCVGAAVTLDVRFVHAGGDIDLELLDGDGRRLAAASSADDDERLVWTSERRGDVFLAVGMYTPGGCSPYRLEVAVDETSCVLTDIDCSNGSDDDGDGLTDCADATDCATDAYCLPETACRNGLDDDADGLTDCADPGCRPTAACTADGNDTCAAPYVLPDDPDGAWYGDTTTAAADVRGSCGGDGPDVVFELTLTARSRLVAVTAGSSFDTVLHLRGSDCAAGASLDCNDDVARGDISSRLDLSLAAGTYHLFVDGWNADAAGAYILTLSTTAIETCTGGLDDDGDSAIDCADLDCSYDAACLPASCAEDLHEDNDSRAAALAISTITSAEYLAVTPSDDDYWSIPVCDGAVVTLDVRFRHADGDIDIYLQDAAGTRLAVGGSSDDDELTRWTSDRDGTVYLRVDLYGTSDPCNLYRLAATVDESACP
jgi:hypothetical protein